MILKLRGCWGGGVGINLKAYTRLQGGGGGDFGRTFFMDGPIGQIGLLRENTLIQSSLNVFVL